VVIHGFGAAGKRVADSVAKLPNMELVGVTKRRPSDNARRAIEKGCPLSLAGAGTLEERI